MTTKLLAEYLEMSASYVEQVLRQMRAPRMPDIDDMQGLDDHDKLLVADTDYNRPVYQGDSDDDR